MSEEELQLLQEDRLHRQRRLRNRWDTDKDSKISNAEREAAKAAIRRTIEQRRVKRFNEVDLDRNSQLTLAEFRNITAVSDADANTPGVALRIFTNLDSDKNETVSTREFLLKLDSLPPAVVDTPLTNEHPRRPITNTPAQALALLNDPQFVEAARGLAARVIDREKPIANLFHFALQRDPSKEETQELEALYKKLLAEFRVNPDAAKSLLAIGQSTYGDHDPINHAAWTATARIVLNLHEFLTRS